MQLPYFTGVHLDDSSTLLLLQVPSPCEGMKFDYPSLSPRFSSYSSPRFSPRPQPLQKRSVAPHTPNSPAIAHCSVTWSRNHEGLPSPLLLGPSALNCASQSCFSYSSPKISSNNRSDTTLHHKCIITMMTRDACHEVLCWTCRPLFGPAPYGLD